MPARVARSRRRQESQEARLPPDCRQKSEPAVRLLARSCIAAHERPIGNHIGKSVGAAVSSGDPAYRTNNHRRSGVSGRTSELPHSRNRLHSVLNLVAAGRQGVLAELQTLVCHLPEIPYADRAAGNRFPAGRQSAGNRFSTAPPVSRATSLSPRRPEAAWESLDRACSPLRSLTGRL